MKKCIFALACLLSLSAHAEKYLTYTDSPGTAVGFATQVVSYNRGPVRRVTRRCRKVRLVHPTVLWSL
jgi:hypothetical protein